MISRAFVVLALAATSTAQDLPVKGQGDLEKEAAQLIEGLPDLTKTPEPPSRSSAAITVAKAEARLEYAKQKRDRWEKLCKQGVVSRVEADSAVMEVYQAAVVCEQARLAEAPDAAAIKECEQKLAAAQAEAHTAKLKMLRANLERYRKLYNERLVTKAQLQRLENALAGLEREAAAYSAPIPSSKEPAAAGHCR